MANYSAPDGYLLDEKTGLYYSQVIAKDENGCPSQVVTWFNANTGEYSQEIYPISGKVTNPTKPVQTVKPKSSNNKSLGVFAVIILLVLSIVASFLYFGKQKKENSNSDSQSSSTISNTVVNSYSQDNRQSQVSTTSISDTSSASSVLKPQKSGETQDPVLDDNPVTSSSENPISQEPQVFDNGSDLYSGEYLVNYIVGVYLAGDVDIPRAFAPTIELRQDKTFTLWLNFSEGMQSFEGTFTLSEKMFEMDDLCVYLTLNETYGMVPQTATILFDSSPDYCYFMDEGFGLMGYRDAPYDFYRDERE